MNWMADDREFDRLLEEELSALPLPDETVEEITPWKRAMTRIVWGVGLTTCTLNFWYLNYLLPAVGVVLLLLGFRTLRKENRWFAFCWAAAAVDAAAFFFLRVKDATLWSGTNVPFGEALALLQLAQSFCLWQGIKAVRRAAGQEDRAGAAAALLVFQTVLTALGLMSGWALQLQGLIFVVPILILYICIMRSLARLPALLDGAGYQVRAARVRLSDRVVWITWAAVLALCIPLAGALFCRYPMEWAPVPDNEQAGLEEIRDNLLDLGMPEQVVDDLAPEDLAALEGALSVTTQVDVVSFRDVRELRASDIAVELPEGRWRIIHHFLWQGYPGPRTTECIKLWPTTQEQLEGGWRQEGGLTGRLLYDWEGTTYTGDYYSISTVNYTSQSIFWGQTENTDPFALFSLPRRGDNCRGYLTYGAEMVEEGWLLSSWNNYTHQVSWLNYPAMTAQEYDMSGMLNGFGAFETSQSAIQFRPREEKGTYQEHRFVD